jgi:photosystem II stability/assembly factor-like uncharacterized protein
MSSITYNQSPHHKIIFNRRVTLKSITSTPLLMSSLISTIAAPVKANYNISPDWEKIELPINTDIVLLDIGFIDDKCGFLLGTRQTLLETIDGGKTWVNREIPFTIDEGINYRFNSISFNKEEGWIVGKPAILLHTKDAGKTWERISLSAKLPGNPLKITALGQGKAEMITDQGAIYGTTDTAQSWRAEVQETVDATLNRTVSSGISGASYFEGYFSNVSRGFNGQYVAVSSRGNFFMTWAPGERNWMPHNRPKGRRLQNMGWGPNDTLWLTSRGGEVLLGNTQGITENFTTTKLQSRGFGILDVNFRSSDVAYACGGSGSLYKSGDGGQTWKRDKSADDIAGNLYAIKFFSDKVGFILGNDAILLRFIGAN